MMALIQNGVEISCSDFGLRLTLLNVCKNKEIHKREKKPCVLYTEA
jgi:hypothetical protein